MLPVDSRQLENVKGELLKLRKKETMAQRSLDRRAEETEEKTNSRLSDMVQRGHKREPKKQKDKESRLSALVKHAREPCLNVMKDKITIRCKLFM
ncbi:hypothetical protein AVEN_159823-1 [Araneus ventricosus]|uniref:Uncharacterized protein n=1 Tax=Araneus ventricosus TaxID=182803 RepID=A0A4Y2EKM1_ARAVE|nr:hypothetical protein AVEN_159823-1 [Araneus ventricosus]